MLPAGRYRVKVYVDHDGRLARDWTAILGKDAFVGQAEFNARWADGNGAMTVLDAALIKP